MTNNFSTCLKQEHVAQDPVIPVLETMPREGTRDFNQDLWVDMLIELSQNQKRN